LTTKILAYSGEISAMRYLLVVCLLLGASAWAQQESTPSKAQPENQSGVPVNDDENEEPALPASASTLPPDAAVITINGLCAQDVSPSVAQTSKPACQTVITRAQFEKLTGALQTNMKPSSKRQLAEAYPRLLAMEKEADARGLENSARFQERLAFARLQILSQELLHEIDVEASKVSDNDIEAYFKSHSAEFQTVTLERIFVPKGKRTDLAVKEMNPEALAAQQKESEDAMTRVSEELRARAIAGESFSALQKEAYAAAGRREVPPNSSLGKVELADLPPGHSSVRDLKPGEISKVLNDANGHYIYKLDDKETDVLDKTRKDEIRTILRQKNKQEEIQAIEQPISAELNPAYFGAGGSSATADSKSK
jgi:PPIC-type PPIASE domain